MSAISSRLKELHTRANHGWPTIWLQSAGGLLFLFGLLCIIRVQPDVFAFGVIFAFAQLFIPDAYLSSVGWSCLVAGVLLGIATFPAQKKQLARFKKDQAMLQRQDWRK
jgi:hypothetical protein